MSTRLEWTASTQATAGAGGRLARLGLVCLIALASAIAPAQPDAAPTDKRVAAVTAGALVTPQDYITRFVLYVRWPHDDALKSWQVCAASVDPARDARYANVSARGRPFSVRHVEPTDSLADCQILDLSYTKRSTSEQFLHLAMSVHGVLTVGEGRDFCSAGGQICLLLDTAHGGFEINLSAIKRSGLAINAQLLMLAHRHAQRNETP